MVLATVEILVVIDVPVHPLGSVHVYEVAPITEITLYVFELFEQIEVLPLIPNGAVGTVFTVIVIFDEVAVADVKHSVLVVITTATMSPLLKAPFVYIALFVPTGLPFNFH